MFIDSKSADLMSSEEGIGRGGNQDFADEVARAHVMATSTRVAFYFSVLALSVMCGYGYVAAVLYGKDSLPPGAVGFTLVFLAILEMSLGDYADRLPFPYVAEESSVLYAFFLVGGFATTSTLLRHESQGAVFTIPALHLMGISAVFTVVLGAVIFWRHLRRGGGKLLDAMENGLWW